MSGPVTEGGAVRYRVIVDNTGAIIGLRQTSEVLRATGAAGRAHLGAIDTAASSLARNLRGNLGYSIRSARNEMDMLGRSGATTGQMLSSGLGVLAGGYLVTRAIAGVKDIVSTYADFDRQMRLMWTNLPYMTEQAFEETSHQAEAFAKKMALTGGDVAKSLYDVTSVGFDPNKAMQKGGILDVSANAALAGDAELPDVNKAIISTLNTYGLHASKAEEVSNKLFATVRDGDVRFADLAQVLSDVTPIAAQSGVSLNDVGASVAVLTKMGFTAGESVDNLRMMISELDKTNSKAGQTFINATGKTFPDFMRAGHSVGEAMQALTKYTNAHGQEAVETFSRIQGAQAFMALSSETGAKYYRSAALSQVESDGLVDDAAKKMRNSTAYALKQSKADWDSFKTTTGAALAPVVKDLAALSGAVADVMKHEWVRKTVEVGLAVGAASFALSKMYGIYKLITGAEMLTRLGALATANRAVAASNVAAVGGGALGAGVGAGGALGAGVGAVGNKAVIEARAAAAARTAARSSIAIGDAALLAAAAGAPARAAANPFIRPTIARTSLSNAALGGGFLAGGTNVVAAERAAAARAAAARVAAAETAAAERSAMRRLAMGGAMSGATSLASTVAPLALGAGAVVLGKQGYDAFRDEDRISKLERGNRSGGTTGNVQAMIYSHDVNQMLAKIPGFGGLKAGSKFSGYDAAMANATADDKLKVAIDQSTATKRFTELAAKEKAVGLTKDEANEVTRLTGKYASLAEQGVHVAANLKAMTEARTQQMQEADALGSQWRGSFNMFDKSPVTVNRDKDIAKARKELASATTAVTSAETAAKKARGITGTASQSSVTSARASILSAQASLQRLRGSRKVSSAQVNAAALRVNAAQQRYNELVSKGGGDTDKLNAAEKTLADARNNRAKAQQALNKAKAPQGLSLKTLASRESGNYKYRMQEVRDIQALSKAGLNQTALNEIFNVEKAHPGTLRRAATQINSKFFREFKTDINRQAIVLQDKSSVVGKALTGMTEEAVATSATRRHAAMARAGRKDADAYAKALATRITALGSSLFGGPAAPTPATASSKTKTGGGMSVTLHNPQFNGVNSPADLFGELKSFNRKQALGRE